MLCTTTLGKKRQPFMICVQYRPPTVHTTFRSNDVISSSPSRPVRPGHQNNIRQRRL